ncbi:histone-lysine N-methyltransferase SETMAR [Trichonephila clavipes]|nr:histone-lysine N-methyltransferase SETMAR [Trichonephila clavipes]
MEFFSFCQVPGMSRSLSAATCIRVMRSSDEVSRAPNTLCGPKRSPSRNYGLCDPAHTFRVVSVTPTQPARGSESPCKVLKIIPRKSSNNAAFWIVKPEYRINVSFLLYLKKWSKFGSYSSTLTEDSLKSENASQVAEIANGAYDPDTVTSDYMQFLFRQFRSGMFDVKDAPRTGRPVIENVDKITEIIQVDRDVSSRVALPRS